MAFIFSRESTEESVIILMGFSDGKIRIVKENAADLPDFSNYIEYSIHDNITGKIKSTCFSQDNRILYTCGDDRNIFSFLYQCIEKHMVSFHELSRPPKIIVS